MQIDLADLPAQAPEWPQGITFRNFVPLQDDQQIHALIQTAFFQPERTPTPLDEWRDLMLRPDIFKPELWFVAQSGDKPVGACLCYEYPLSGWVRQLGVLEEWRRKGIGAALLKQAFFEFKQRGCEKVGLAVESKRPDAHSFYINLGMHPTRQYDEAVKKIQI